MSSFISAVLLGAIFWAATVFVVALGMQVNHAWLLMLIPDVVLFSLMGTFVSGVFHE